MMMNVGENQVLGRSAIKPGVDVLIVDDDTDIRETMHELLEHAGYSAATAGNGREALRWLSQHEAQLILLDLSMPIMNGQQFRAEQVKHPELATIPTVVLTAADRAREKTSEMRLDGVLFKPIKLDVLLDCVRRFCGNASA